MKRKKIKLVLILCIVSYSSFTQSISSTNNATKSISKKDSLLLKKYTKQLQSCRLYSNNYQLYYDSILLITPWSAYDWQQKSMPLFKQNKYEIGMACMDSAVKYDTKDMYLEYRGFLKCIFQKNYSGALEDFILVKKNKGFGFVMDHSYDFFMGLSFMQLNKYSQADSLILNSISWNEIKSKPGHYLEYYYLGIIKMVNDQDSIAINYFDKTLNIYPQFPDALFYKALCQKNLHFDLEAKATIKKGIVYFNEGYTDNEDDSRYEDYPYHVNKYHYDEMVKYLSAE